MNSRVLQLTKRELQSTAVSARFWTGLIAVVAVLTVSGPFDTHEDFTLPQRAIYWLGITVSTYFTAILLMVPLITWAQDRGLHDALTSVVAGLLGGPFIGLLVYLINTFIAGNDHPGLFPMLRLIAVSCVITAAVIYLRFLVLGCNEEAQAERPAFEQRIPAAIRAPLISLQAQDHYIEVTTTRGRDLVLMRLGDAMGELGGVDGMQIHRSWWVARAGVEEISRQNDRMSLSLVDGRTVPVSRANEKAVRAWLAPGD